MAAELALEPAIEIRYEVPGPTVGRFHASDARHRGIMGPIGSGKTVACCMDLFRWACEQEPYKGVRYTRFAIIRNTYPELRSTTIKTWQEWFPREICPITFGAPITGLLHIPLPDGTWVHMEIVFIALDRPDHVGKLKSLELTGFYINEASEVHKAIFDMADGRIRRYPQPRWGGPSRIGSVMDTNAMEDDHWWYRFAEEEKPHGYEFFRQPPAVLEDPKPTGIGYKFNPECENAQNLGPEYWMDQIPGKSREWIRVYLQSQYGTVAPGRSVYPEFSDFLHVQTITVMENIPLRLGWDFGRCYSEDTEVLTEKGWRLFGDVAAHEKVATKNPATGEMEFHVPAFRVDEHYEGEMLEWVSPEVNMLVTPEHLVACRDDHKPNELVWRSAQWLSEHNYGHWRVDVTSQWQPDGWTDPMHFGIRAGAFAKLLGLYLSEGSTEKNGNSYRISIYQNRRRDDMQAILDETEVAWTWTGQSWRVTHNALGRWLHAFGKAWEKRVPREIANMPLPHILAFIKAYTLGDGHVRARRRDGYAQSEEHTIYTTSERMAADLQELAQKVGWSSSVCWVPSQTSTMVEGGLARSITGRGGYSVRFKKVNKSAGLHARHCRRVQYSGRIYCFNVPYHTLYVRRGGRAHWNGNTPACTIEQLSPSGQLRTLHELVTDNPLDLNQTQPSMGIKAFANDVVRPFIKNHYDGARFESVGDPAGTALESDELSCMMYLKDAGFPTKSARTNLFIPRREAVAAFLNKMVEGQPGYLIDPGCRILRKGFNGRYKYRKMQIPDEDLYQEMPIKNAYSHPHDAHQYVALECMTDEEMKRAQDLRKRTRKRRRASSKHSWRV